MSPFEFWFLLIVAGVTITAMFGVAVRMLVQS